MAVIAPARRGVSARSAARRLPPSVVAVAFAMIGAGCMLPLYALEPGTATTLAGAGHAAALVLAVVLMYRVAARGDAEMRRPRLLFAAAMSASVVAAVIGVGYAAQTGTVPVPSLVDLVAPLWVPLAACGFWAVPTREGETRSLSRLAADGAVAASALLLTSWLLVLEPMRDSDRLTVAGKAVLFGYPLTDVFIAAVVLSLLPLARADLRPFLNCVAFGLLLLAVGDTGFALTLAEHGALTFGWADVVMQAGLMVLVYATVIRKTQVLRERRIASRLDWALPFAPVLASVAVSLWHVATTGYVGLEECVLAAAMIVAILVRQLTYVRELTRVAEVHRYAAGHDELTGLANRKAFMAVLADHVRTPGAPAAAVLLADLDGFKEVNDTLGHDVGDQVLARFAGTLESCVGEGVVARLGGDEFAVLLPVHDETPEAAIAVATAVARARLPVGGGLDVSCAVGVAPLLGSDTAAGALRRADLAMYAAKQLSSPCVAVFTEAMAHQADRRHLLTAQLAGAVDRDEMSLVFQPLYRLGDGMLAGAEALLRWHHPVFGSVRPDEFIPLAEDSGHIIDIGRWVIDTALAQLAAWERDGHYLPRLFVNTAASQFTDDLADEVTATLDRHGVPPGRLTLEITETQVPGLAVNTSMRRLRESGVHVALDDFGSGYSSLAQIARLPVDVIKIDRDFIRNLDARTGRPIMDAIVTLARALGMTTVAEGIEDVGQAAEVSNAGIDYAQGYLFSRPVRAEDLVSSLLPVPTAAAGGGTGAADPHPAGSRRQALDPTH